MRPIHSHKLIWFMHINDSTPCTIALLYILPIQIVHCVLLTRTPKLKFDQLCFEKVNFNTCVML
jgi:hypothetical protein